MKEMDDIEKLFSSTFDGAEMAPPGAVKEGIDKSLFGGKAKIGGYWWIGLIAIVLIGGTTLFFLNTGESVEDTLVSTTTEQTADGDDLSTQSESQKNENNGESANGQFTSTENEQTNAESSENETSEQQNNLLGTQMTEGTSSDEILGQNSVDEESPSFDSNTLGDLADMEELPTADKTPSEKNNEATDEKSNSSGDVAMNGGENLVDVESTSEGETTEKNRESTGSEEANVPVAKDSEAHADNAFSDSMNDAETSAKETSNGSENENKVASVDEMSTSPVEKLETTDLEKSLLTTSAHPKPPGTGRKGLWSLALYSGMTYGSNKLKSNTPTTMRLNESVGFYSSLEACYHLSDKLMNVSFGFDYSQQKYSLTDDLMTISNVYTGDSLVVIFDTNQQVTDSIFYPMYDQVSTTEMMTTVIQHQSFGIPIYLTHSVLFGASRFRLNLGIGARFSYSKYSVLDAATGIQTPEFRKFGLNLQLRPELYYPIGRFSVGVYGKLEYDLLQGMQWTEIRHNRWGTGAGISLRYRL